MVLRLAWPAQVEVSLLIDSPRVGRLGENGEGSKEEREENKRGHILGCRYDLAMPATGRIQKEEALRMSECMCMPLNILHSKY